MTEPKPSKPPKPPAHEIRLGRIRVQAWMNEGATTGPWYSVTVERLYQAVEGAKTIDRSAHSFGRDDLPVVAECVRQMWVWVMSRLG